MARDNILDEAERKQRDAENTDAADQPPDDTDDTATGTDDGGGEADDTDTERTRLTQRVPDDLLADIEAIEEKYRLGSRNAAVNFMLSHAADDLLEGRDRS